MKNVYDETLVTKAYSLAASWAEGEGPSTANAEDIAGWSSTQVRASTVERHTVGSAVQCCAAGMVPCPVQCCQCPVAPSPGRCTGITAQVVAFLDKLNELRAEKPLTPEVTRRMNEHYAFDATGNAEIKASWYNLCIRAGDKAILPLVVKFLKSQGRMKVRGACPHVWSPAWCWWPAAQPHGVPHRGPRALCTLPTLGWGCADSRMTPPRSPNLQYVRPLFRALMASDIGQETAVETYREHHENYHPICSKMLAVDLKLTT